MVRERSTGSYRVAPYFLAKSMSDIGMYTVAPIGFALVVYWCIGLRADFVHFLIFLVFFMSQVRERGREYREWARNALKSERRISGSFFTHPFA